MLESIDKKFVLQTYARNYVNFTKGVNATLYDDNNKDYIDFTSGIGVVSVGHGNEQVANKICEQAKKITHISNLFLIEPQALLAKKINELAGFDVATFFANSGAEANEGAIKIARKYGQVNFENKRYKIITLEHSFHGRTITTVKATGQAKFHSDCFAPYPEGFRYDPTFEAVYNSIDDETVAVMIELIQGEGGVNPFKKEEIQALAKFLKEKEILLIVDEVQTGVYRSGEFLACKEYGIEPDIITLAKGLGGGVPIGAVLTKHKNLLSYGDHGSTFGGNYLVTAAAIEVLDILQEYKQSGKLDEHIEYFDSKLRALQTKFSDIMLDVTGFGLMRGIKIKDDDTLAKIIDLGFKEGVLILKSGRSTLRFLPPLTINKGEIDKGFQRLEDALKKI
ncbi:MAG: aspartate aminotransferase family protein [Arcobacteraceae bacterium]|jgi:acetylornithine aminotransferase|nr:aspartate aminotransferase family protein [Arcobacteraceae bacterium]MDY0365018.1 aspartate aminotransferase family protein [Arcobacteraceae bacterium]